MAENTESNTEKSSTKKTNTEESNTEINDNTKQEKVKPEKAIEEVTPIPLESEISVASQETTNILPEKKEENQEKKEETVEKVSETHIKKIKKEKKPKPIEKIKNVKVKRKLEGEEKRLFKIASNIKAKKPKFLRQQYGMVMRLDEVWRKPRGIDSKMRVEKRGQGHLVKVGYKKPESIRGIHPSGYWPVMVNNINDLEKIDNTKQAAIIASCIGRKKRNEIIKKANELKIVILNPRKREI